MYSNFQTFIKMLGNLTSWLDEAKAFAEQHSIEPEVLLQGRLYPDMFPLVRQIQSSCDTAKLAAARVSGVEAPVHEDSNDATVDQLKSRIAEVIAFIEGIDQAKFGDEDKLITLAFLQNMQIRSIDYVEEFAVPNFFFHLSMSYANLRHCGVRLGKRSYLGSLSLKPPAS